MHSYGGLLFTPLAFLTYLARTARSTSPPLPKGKSLLHSALVQVLPTGPFRDQQKTRGLAADLGIRSTNLRLLAWVCCPLSRLLSSSGRVRLLLVDRPSEHLCVRSRGPSRPASTTIANPLGHVKRAPSLVGTRVARR